MTNVDVCMYVYIQENKYYLLSILAFIPEIETGTVYIKYENLFNKLTE